MPNTNIKFDEYLAQQLKDPDFKQSFEEESSKLESAIALTEARRSAGLSQRELSSMADVPQSTIARIESGDNTSVNTLTKIANAMNKTVKITIS